MRVPSDFAPTLNGYERTGADCHQERVLTMADPSPTAQSARATAGTAIAAAVFAGPNPNGRLVRGDRTNGDFATHARRFRTEIGLSKYDHNPPVNESATAREAGTDMLNGPTVDQPDSAATDDSFRRTGAACEGDARCERCCSADVPSRRCAADRPTAVDPAGSRGSCCTKDRGSAETNAPAHGASLVPWNRMDRNTVICVGELLVTTWSDPGWRP